eukprot:6167963-Pleurochrysis_carterae.AAC.1
MRKSERACAGGGARAGKEREQQKRMVPMESAGEAERRRDASARHVNEQLCTGRCVVLEADLKSGTRRGRYAKKTGRASLLQLGQAERFQKRIFGAG